MILVATGLQREARSLAGTPLSVIAGGGDRQRLEAELERGAAEADAIISIGLGGALLEGLWPGDWVVASAIVCPERLDHRHRQRLDGAPFGGPCPARVREPSLDRTS